ncbi:MAG: hypothetical protein ACLFQA_00180 [Bacteroidales bacterium]
MEGHDVKIYIGNEEIATTIECDIGDKPDNVDISGEWRGAADNNWSAKMHQWFQKGPLPRWEYYMRRGRNHYFRSNDAKIKALLDHKLDVEYGTLFDLNYEFE